MQRPPRTQNTGTVWEEGNLQSPSASRAGNPRQVQKEDKVGVEKDKGGHEWKYL